MTRAPFEIGLAARALSGDGESGDRPVVLAFSGGFLLGVVDGVGHGRQAADAAEVVVATLADVPHLPVRTLLASCHGKLRQTRGATLTVASFDLAAEQLIWAGVGDVDALLVRANGARGPQVWSPVLCGGILGIHLPRVIECQTHVEPEDTLVFVTDGIDKPFERILDPRRPPQAIADRILKECATEFDDALVLVARYRPGGQVSGP